MKKACIFVLAAFLCSSGVFDQDSKSVIKTEAWIAFVWGEDAPSGAVSSTVQDPVTGSTIRKLAYAGTEVSSRLGFERAGADEAGTFLNFTTTIANSTDSTLSVRHGGVLVDGLAASPLRVVSPGAHVNKREHKNKRDDMVQLETLRCFTSGFLSSDAFFSAETPSEVLTVAPQTALTVSSIIRDPRNYRPLLCTVDGCQPTGLIRYFIKVNRQEYVFVWPGRSAVYCGK